MFLGMVQKTRLFLLLKNNFIVFYLHCKTGTSVIASDENPSESPREMVCWGNGHRPAASAQHGGWRPGLSPAGARAPKVLTGCTRSLSLKGMPPTVRFKWYSPLSS